jgi:hypothetical protein
MSAYEEVAADLEKLGRTALRIKAQRDLLLAACLEAHKYFRNRPGNQEIQLSAILGVAIAEAES